MNRPENFMEIEVDVKCIQTNFGGHGLFGFRNFAPFCFPSKTTMCTYIVLHRTIIFCSHFELSQFSPYFHES